MMETIKSDLGAPGSDVYVDPSKGDDENNGTAESPFRTTEKAFEVLMKRGGRAKASGVIRVEADNA